jgi:uncharacterized phiE125 gp8 family phage protein
MFLYKNPIDTRKYTITFDGYVLQTEAIQSSGLTITVTNIATDGVSTSGIYVPGSLSFSGNNVSFRLTGGDDDAAYRLSISTGGVTSSGNVYTQTGYLYVADEEQSLVSLGDLKAYLGVNTTANDAVLLSLLRASTDFVQRVTGRNFLYTKYTDTYYPEQCWDRLKLNNYPVDRIQSVLIDGITLDSQTAGYSNFVLEQEGYIRRLDGVRFPQAPVPIVVSYFAGFRAVPEDIRYAVMKIAGSDYNTRLQDGILSEALGSYKIVHDKSSVMHEDSRVREILQNYTPRVF